MGKTGTRELSRDALRRQRGWIGTLAALMALVVVGFLGGALVGFLWEEPRLVFAYLSGETDSVEWSDPAPFDVAAPPPDPAAPPAPKPSRSAAPKPAPAPPSVAAVPKPAPSPAPPPKAKPAPVAAPAPPPAAPAARPAAKPAPAAASTGRFAVQVGAFSESAAAQRLAESLRKRGYPAYVAPAPGGTARWRVRVGPLPTRPEADALAAKLKRAEELSTWVLDEGAG